MSRGYKASGCERGCLNLTGVGPGNEMPQKPMQSINLPKHFRPKAHHPVLRISHKPSGIPGLREVIRGHESPSKVNV